MSAAPGGRGAHVLIVEDEFLLAAEIDDVLRERGFTVVGPVASLDDGLRLAVEEGLDAAVLDARIVGGTSAPIAHALAARGCPFVVVTGAPSLEDASPPWPAAPVLTKPISHATLLHTLDALLAR